MCISVVGFPSTSFAVSEMFLLLSLIYSKGYCRLKVRGVTGEVVDIVC